MLNSEQTTIIGNSHLNIDRYITHHHIYDSENLILYKNRTIFMKIIINAECWHKMKDLLKYFQSKFYLVYIKSSCTIMNTLMHLNILIWKLCLFEFLCNLCTNILSTKQMSAYLQHSSLTCYKYPSNSQAKVQSPKGQIELELMSPVGYSSSPYTYILECSPTTKLNTHSFRPAYHPIDCKSG